MSKKRQWILASGLALIAALASSSAQAKDEVDRIREKAEELAQKIQSERFSHMSEGKDSNLDRVYKDFDYLLKESKNELVTEALSGASSEMADRLERLNNFLLHGRIYAPIASSFDQAYSYEADAAMDVGATEITLDTFDRQVANEDGRTNRRIWYLASRDLQENFNVFQINLLIDLDRQAAELTGMSYQQFLAEQWDLDSAKLKDVCLQVLEATDAEYKALLPAAIGDAFEDMSVEDFREYDMGYLLRAKHLDETFEGKKAADTAEKWLKGMGLSPKKMSKLRVKIDNKEGMADEPAVFPVDNARDTRASMVPYGGLPDYWNILGVLGRAQFYFNIDTEQPFEYQRVGSPLHAWVYGALYQNVLGDAAWRDKFLKLKGDPGQVATAIRFRQLFELRKNAAHYIFQHRLYEDSKTPPSEYANWMQEQMGYSHGSTEETNYLTCQDLHMSGIKVWAAVLAAQLSDKLTVDFGEDWWAKGETGNWLKARWSTGFKVHTGGLPQALEVGETNVAAVAAD